MVALPFDVIIRIVQLQGKVIVLHINRRAGDLGFGCKAANVNAIASVLRICGIESILNILKAKVYKKGGHLHAFDNIFIGSA